MWFKKNKEEKLMNYISKHFTADANNQIILDRADWSDEAWQGFLILFGVWDADRIVVSEYKVDIWSKKEED